MLTDYTPKTFTSETRTIEIQDDDDIFPDLMGHPSEIRDQITIMEKALQECYPGYMGCEITENSRGNRVLLVFTKDSEEEVAAKNAAEVNRVNEEHYNLYVLIRKYPVTSEAYLASLRRDHNILQNDILRAS